MINLTKALFLIGICSFLIGCKKNSESIKNENSKSDANKITIKKTQDSIATETLRRAYKYDLYSQEFQSEIDKSLAQDSTIAYLWQQKAMPLFKQGKHEKALEFMDRAVKYDRQGWQDYRAFMKCIFAKTYQDAISDFQDYKKKYGYSYIMDHSFDFYIGLSYLQLNEFKKAELIFKKDYDYQLKEKGKEWLHHLDLFYYGISKYEQKDWIGAINLFNESLKIYPNFSEAQIFKSDCLRRIGKINEANELQKLGETNGRKGNTINEANAIYERYPYQIRWY